MVLNFPNGNLFPYFYIIVDAFFLTHGHIYNEDNLPSLGKGDVFLYGHTHIPVAEKKGVYTQSILALLPSRRRIALISYCILKIISLG